MSDSQPAEQGTAPGPYAPRRLPPAVLVDTPASFARMMAEMAGERLLALDTESDSLYRYFYKVCLIQVSIPGADYLLDPLRLPDLEPLGAILADPAIQKVFHAAENDILMLKRDFGFAFANIFDTMLAARILGWPRVSLAALLAEHFGVQLDKNTQLTDWGHRPLAPRQLSYARLDSHYLLPLRELLDRELHNRRRWREAQETFAALPDVTYAEKPFDPDGFWKLKGARDLQPRQLAVLQELYLWREGQARALNRPPFKIISEEALLQLSQAQPQQPADLPLGSWQISRFGHGIVEAIGRGRAAPPPAHVPRPQNGNSRPDAAALARYDRLRAWRIQKAAERGVEADVVLTNDTLMAIARAAPASIDALTALGVMGAWKLEEYSADVLRVLAET